MAAENSRTAIYSLKDLKNCTDDAIPIYLSSIRYKQSHYHLDIRLALGYTAVSLAAFTLLLDWKMGFEHTKAYTSAVVLLYVMLNAVLSYRIWIFERGSIYQGNLNGQELILRSRVEKMIPTYLVDITYTIPRSPSEKGPIWRQIEFSAPFSQWFTADGYFVVKLFHNWLASNISKICIKSEDFVDRNDKNGHNLKRIAPEGEVLSGIGYTTGSTARSRKRG